MKKMSKFHKSLAIATASVILAAGFTSSALAAPAFTIMPSFLGGPGGTVQGDQFNGPSSELLQITGLK